jgi:penicillin-binding protein 1A
MSDIQNPGTTQEQNNRKIGIVQILFFGVVGTTVFVMAAAAVIFWHFSKDLPKIITAADYHPLTVTRVYGVPGGVVSSTSKETLMAEFYKERRYLTPFEKIPDIVVRSFISAEDDQFFEHPGINILSMIRAGIANFRAGHYVQGASTITQQMVKSLLLTPEKSMSRKIKELILASRIEKNLTKQQILYLYLNQIYLGHGAYGVQAASQTYFRKDIGDLNTAEAALLAGLPQAPGKYF